MTDEPTRARPVVLFVAGTDIHPFTRFVDWADRLAGVMAGFTTFSNAGTLDLAAGTLTVPAAVFTNTGNYTGSDYLDSKLFFSYLQPSIRSWNEGDDRNIVCVIVATGKPVTGSAVAPTATSTTIADGDAEGDQGSKAERVGDL